MMATVQLGEAWILLGITLLLLGLLAPFFLWVNLRGLRRENRRNLEALRASVDELVVQQRKTNALVESQQDPTRQKN